MKKSDNFKNIRITIDGGMADVGKIPDGIRVIIKDKDMADVGDQSRFVYEGKPAPIKLSTVSVIEFGADIDLLSLRCFVDNEEGNRQAENLFHDCMIENGADKNDETLFRQSVEDGVYDNGGYTVVIAHST